MKSYNKVIPIILGVLVLGAAILMLMQSAKLQKNISVTQDIELERNAFQGGSPKKTRQNCLADECLLVDDFEYPADELSTEIEAALKSALDDEYKAFSIYQAVIDKFGSQRPFIMILRAEEQHISSLKALFDKYGVEIPENSYLGNITAPESLSEACNMGVDAEIENAALYKEQLLPAVSEYEDITSVFNNLMSISQNKHLSAFQRCSE